MKIRHFSWPDRLRETARVVPLVGCALAAAGCASPAKVDVADSASSQLNGAANGFVDEGDPNANLDTASCLTQKSGAEQRKVALYMMLDSSGSMAESTGTIRTKWDSVQRAIRGFLGETRDSDLLLGMQFFPLARPGSQFFCTKQSDCGDDGGPCFLSTCRNSGTIQLCQSNADCPGGALSNPCVDFGLCSKSDPAALLACVLGEAGSCGTGQGVCQDIPQRPCTNATSCDPAAYGTPAVEIQPVSTGLTAIDQALMGKNPEGLTPTVPALTGALQHAREWALAHPDQTVATLLATDGLPTECGVTTQQAGSTVAINQVLDIAAKSAADDVPIRTFVIGVFQPGDSASINNVNAIAQAGGTDSAVFIDTTGDVDQQFLDALRNIRSGQLACEFKIPQSDQQLDYFKVNLEFNDGTSTRQLGFVRDEGGCGSSPLGWHYDVDPNQKKPTSIQICPSICEQVKAAASGSITLQLGCATILR